MYLGALFTGRAICSGWLGTPTILTISTALKNIFSSFAGPVKWQSVQSSKVPDYWIKHTWKFLAHNVHLLKPALNCVYTNLRINVLFIAIIYCCDYEVMFSSLTVATNNVSVFCVCLCVRVRVCVFVCVCVRVCFEFTLQHKRCLVYSHTMLKMLSYALFRPE